MTCAWRDQPSGGGVAVEEMSDSGDSMIKALFSGVNDGHVFEDQDHDFEPVQGPVSFVRYGGKRSL